jgi:SPP1 gp7 family putative phage head morphogenesis protein
VPSEPLALRAQYARDLVALVRRIGDVVKDVVVSRLPQLERQASVVAVLDTRDAPELFDAVKVKLEFAFSPERLRKLTRGVGEESARHQRTQLERQLSKVAVDVLGAEPYLDGAIRDFTRENLALIRGLKDDTLADLERRVTRAVADGQRASEIATEIEERLGVSESRARLIARDQVSKFQGDLAQLRQRELGITKYKWSTLGDGRERDEHKAQDGKVFEWGDPPPTGHPGEDVQCRCYAEPVLEDLAGE